MCNLQETLREVVPVLFLRRVGSEYIKNLHLIKENHQSLQAKDSYSGPPQRCKDIAVDIRCGTVRVENRSYGTFLSFNPFPRIFVVLTSPEHIYDWSQITMSASQFIALARYISHEFSEVANSSVSALVPERCYELTVDLFRSEEGCLIRVKFYPRSYKALLYGHMIRVIQEMCLTSAIITHNQHRGVCTLQPLSNVPDFVITSKDELTNVAMWDDAES